MPKKEEKEAIPVLAPGGDSWVIEKPVEEDEPKVLEEERGAEVVFSEQPRPVVEQPVEPEPIAVLSAPVEPEPDELPPLRAMEAFSTMVNNHQLKFASGEIIRERELGKYLMETGAPVEFVEAHIPLIRCPKCAHVYQPSEDHLVRD